MRSLIKAPGLPGLCRRHRFTGLSLLANSAGSVLASGNFVGAIVAMLAALAFAKGRYFTMFELALCPLFWDHCAREQQHDADTSRLTVQHRLATASVKVPIMTANHV